MMVMLYSKGIIRKYDLAHKETIKVILSHNWCRETIIESRVRNTLTLRSNNKHQKVAKTPALHISFNSFILLKS